MSKKLKPIWKYTAFFILGFIIASNIPNIAELNSPQGIAIERNSPSNWINENQIEVTKNKITINLEGAKWSKFTDTNSMDPVLDIGANAIQIIPQDKYQLKVGDIITYNNNNQKIIHRIIEIKNDGNWYAIAKGDNNSKPDPVKIRFNDIEKVLVGIIY